MNNDNIIAKDFLFELVERISRFYIHLDEIRSQFYFNETARVNDKLIFIQSYKDCLIKYFEVSQSIYNDLLKNPSESPKHIQSIRRIITNINHLHTKYLSHLPRPSEPIELKRFGRIIDKHVVNLGKVLDSEKIRTLHESPISIYLSEEVGEATYVRDPVFQFKNGILNKDIDYFNQINGSKLGEVSFDTSEIQSFHISIPRIDANNPCRWPTLIHEVAHKIYNEEYFNKKGIDDDFKDGLDDFQKSFLSTIQEKINIKSWLIECWCDLFACLVTGPVFWLSQFSAFIFQEEQDINTINKIYPKALFRLTLIKRILEHRFPNIFTDEINELIHSSESILVALDNEDRFGFQNEDDIRQLFLYFRVYFLNYFFTNNQEEIQFDSLTLNKNLKPLVKYTKEIKVETIKQLVESLIKGFPIPSKKLSKESLIEKPTYIQEILLAAWIYRNNEFKEEILSRLKTGKPVSEILKSDIVKGFKRFDQSILRSIQVSEWFDILQNDNPERDFELSNDPENKVDSDSSLLNDFEMITLLRNGELQIIPIMNLQKQLGSTSFDIRLGTSFQFYLHTKYGVIDFTDSENDTSRIHNSRLVDLDFLDFIIISPGQFILGHSMEYLKLPSNLAGQVDGRSSFARLGLQVHMTAGFVDPGFEGVLTLEIFNAGPNPIKLFPGLRIGQLRLFNINKPTRPYNRNIEAKYKGLLSQHDSMQFKDYEVEKIRTELESKKMNNS